MQVTNHKKINIINHRNRDDVRIQRTVLKLGDGSKYHRSTDCIME